MHLNCDFGNEDLVTEFYTYNVERFNAKNFYKQNVKMFSQCSQTVAKYGYAPCVIPKLYEATCKHFPIR